jgi:hypothetical protein
VPVLSTDDNETPVAIAAMHSLRRVFVHLLDSRGAAATAAAAASSDAPAHRSKRQRTADSSSSSGGESPVSPEAAYRAWLQARFHEYIARLLSWLRDSEDPNFRLPALRTLMGFVELEPLLVPITQSAAQGGRFSNGVFSKVVAALVLHAHSPAAPSQTKLLAAFGSEYVNSYDDVRYYMLISVKRLARRAAADDKVCSAAKSWKSVQCSSNLHALHYSVQAKGRTACYNECLTRPYSMQQYSYVGYHSQ